jgi:hypothetical protein
MSTRYAQSCPNHFILRTIWTTTHSFVCLILPGRRVVKSGADKEGQGNRGTDSQDCPGRVERPRLKKFTKPKVEALSRLLNKFIEA